MNRVVRVLVVDDSAYVRKVVQEMLARRPNIEVIATARNGKEALEKVEQYKPDVVTCDLIMPEMNGVEFIQEQMKRQPVPTIILSIVNEAGEMALNALEAGAVDFIQKPSALATDKIFDISEELARKIEAASEARINRPPAMPAAPIMPLPATAVRRQHRLDLVAIGISTGGPQALRLLIPQIPADFPVPIAIVMHMPVGYTEMYAQKLNEAAALSVCEAREGDDLAPGKVFVAPAGRHMTFRRLESGGTVIHLDTRPFDTLHRPSVDVMFQSAAETFGSRVLGVVMTGMGSDGKQGAAWIKAQGGLIFTESEETCVVYGMPGSVAEAGLSDRSVPLDRLAEVIQETA